MAFKPIDKLTLVLCVFSLERGATYHRFRNQVSVEKHPPLGEREVVLAADTPVY